jgi:hypothetical protein
MTDKPMNDKVKYLYELDEKGREPMSEKAAQLVEDKVREILEVIEPFNIDWQEKILLNVVLNHSLISADHSPKDALAIATHLWTNVNGGLRNIVAEKQKENEKFKRRANGGKATAAKLTPEERKAKASKAAKARWDKPS